MFGEVLRNRIEELSETTYTRKKDMSSFWYRLRDIALEEISHYSGEIDSGEAIETYYTILKANEQSLPDEAKEILPSNGQERYRVCNRNLWSSNSWHPIGLENTTTTTVTINDKRRGNKRIYKGGKSEC